MTAQVALSDRPVVQEYAQLLVRVRELVESCVPEDSTVAVVSRGDGELLSLDRRIGWHFPRAQSGSYAGHHPADDADAITRLEAIRADGASFLVLPATSYWWLDYYTGFRQHLLSRYRRVADVADTAVIFSLAEPPPEHLHEQVASDDGLIANIRAVAAALLPAGSPVAVVSEGDARLLDLGGPIGWHFPQRQGGAHEADPPADTTSLMAHLDVLRTAGAEYLFIPQITSNFLKRYPGMWSYLDRTLCLVTRQENVGTIYDLVRPTTDGRRERRKHG